MGLCKAIRIVTMLELAIAGAVLSPSHCLAADGEPTEIADSAAAADATGASTDDGEQAQTDEASGLSPEALQGVTVDGANDDLGNESAQELIASEPTDEAIGQTIDEGQEAAASMGDEESEGGTIEAGESIVALEQHDDGLELPENAVDVNEGTYLIETGVANDKVLGVADATPKGHSAVKSYTYNDKESQKWNIERDDASGWYRILLVGTTRPLALGKAYSGNSVELLYPEVVGDRALWAFVPSAAGSLWYNMINRAVPDMLLDISHSSTANGAAALLYKTSESAKNRRFYLIDTKPTVESDVALDEGAYKITPSANSGISVETRGAKTADGTNVWLYKTTGNGNQKIYFEPVRDGLYAAWIAGTGKVMTPANAKMIPGVNVVQKTYTGSNLQLWALQKHGSVFALVNKASGLALGAGGSKSGSNLALTRNDAYKTTLFNVSRTPLLSAGVVEIHPRTNSKVSLDVRGAATGTAGLVLWNDTNAINQRFELVSAGKTDHWRIRTASSGGWVSEVGTDGSNVKQAGKGSDAATDANTWKVVYKGGWYSLINCASGKALDMRRGKTEKGTEVAGYTPNGRDSQHFTIQKATLIQPGYGFLKNAGGRFLDLAGASRKSGANIRVADRSNKVAQVFYFEQVGNAWRISNALSELYLTSASTKSGANVCQKELASTDNQLWKISIADGGGIQISNAADSKLLLTAYKAGENNNANVYVTSYKHGTPQLWKPVTLTEGSLTSKQKSVVRAALSTPSPGAGLCAAWITDVFVNAGIGYYGGDACDQYRWFCKSDNLSKLRTGMIVAVSTHGHTWAGGIWGHVSVYVGNGKVMDNIGYIRTMSVYKWVSYYGDRVTPKWGWFGKSLA